MRHGFNRRLPLMLLPLALSGCCTYITVDTSTHAFRHDSVRRIEKVGITADDKLVVLVDGTKAESWRIKPYTITVTLPANEDFVRVPQDGMTNGWEAEAFGRRDTLPVAIGPAVVLPAYETINYHEQCFLEIAGTDQTLYLVQHLKPDKETPLYYVENGRHPRKIEIDPDGREVKTPRRYPFLLLVPFSVALDAVTWPYQIYSYPHGRTISPFL